MPGAKTSQNDVWQHASTQRLYINRAAADSLQTKRSSSACDFRDVMVCQQRLRKHSRLAFCIGSQNAEGALRAFKNRGVTGCSSLLPVKRLQGELKLLGAGSEIGKPTYPKSLPQFLASGAPRAQARENARRAGASRLSGCSGASQHGLHKGNKSQGLRVFFCGGRLFSSCGSGFRH